MLGWRHSNRQYPVKQAWVSSAWGFDFECFNLVR